MFTNVLDTLPMLAFKIAAGVYAASLLAGAIRFLVASLLANLVYRAFKERGGPDA